ncbi:acyltransferase family protein [Streptomyces sp. NPDC008343]|uniref:acyltransferase family protein n=1 Tax=Streptomyces sp. NPDC008343 TaxID=3364828 RepID=UPI0036E80328
MTEAVCSRREEPHSRCLQGLRAVAVGLVAPSHAGMSRVSGGYVGVDVFFVISGFLFQTNRSPAMTDCPRRPGKNPPPGEGMSKP